MAARTVSNPTNPLARLAGMVPLEAARTVSVVARLAGALFALWYAYDQYLDFNDRYFPRTWAFTVAVAVLAALSLAPIGGRFRALVPALGSGLLVFAGAMLADGGWGVAVLVAGVAGWLGTAVVNHRRGESVSATVSGLFLGSGLAFLLVLATVLLVDE